MEFAIVDIETTGGHASTNGITEVAICIHDGSRVLQRYETLVNPGQPIPYFISALTGIDDMMVLQGRVFVAHNVNFDYSFLKHYLDKHGYELNTKKLCTVRLSRKILPGMVSYSLGKLCAGLNISNNARHRAGGDAEATAELFTLLYSKDGDGHIRAMLKQGSKEQALPANLPREKFINLPYCPGIYYFKNRKGKVIYVGKARNIKYRVASHFTGTNVRPQRQHFLREIYDIDYTPCGNELMALLLEYKEIKRLWPAYNSALKRFEPKTDLCIYQDQRGYLRLGLDKHRPSNNSRQTFSSLAEGHAFINRLVEDFGLCQKMCGYCADSDACETAEKEEQACACNGMLEAETYNSRVLYALECYNKNMPSYIITDKGRNAEEHSCLYIERGNFYGMGYVSVHSQLQAAEDIKACMDRYPSNSYVMTLIDTFCRNNPAMVRQLEG